MIASVRLFSWRMYFLSILIFMSSAMTLEEQRAGWYPLHRLAAMTSLQAAQRLSWLLSTGQYHVDQLDNKRTTPLMVACVAGNSATVRLLLQQGADPNLGAHMPPVNPEKWPLFFAIDGGRVCEGQDCGSSSLILATQEGHLGVVWELISSDNIINWPYATDCDGNNVLITALKNKRWRLVNWLLQTSESLILIRTKEIFNSIPSISAYRSKVLKLFLQAPRTQVDRSGENALMYAIRANSYAMAAALIDGGYRIPSKYQDKNAMIEYLESLKYVDSDVRLLISRLLVPYSVVKAIRKR